MRIIRLLSMILIPALFAPPVFAGVKVAGEFERLHPAASVSFSIDGLPRMVTGAAEPAADPAISVPAFVRRWGSWFGIGDRDSLEFHSVFAVDGQGSFRYRHFHDGLPVLDSDLVVTVSGGVIRTISSGISDVGDPDTSFSVGMESAAAAAISAIGPSGEGAAISDIGKVLAPVGGEHRAVWLVEATTQDPPSRWRALVSGRDGAVLLLQQTVFNATGNVYPECPEKGNWEKRQLDNLASPTLLSGKYVDVYSNCFNCSDMNRLAKADGSGNYVHTPNEGSKNDPFAEVMAYYQLNRMHDFMAANGFAANDGHIPVSVNNTSGQMSCNAAYTGENIMVGLCISSSPAINFAYDATVVMHEYVHAGVDHAAKLAQYWSDEWGFGAMPLGLHEGYADLLPSVLMDDPLIGRHAGKALGYGGPIRDLSELRACPEWIHGEAHEDGRIWSSANWLAYERSGRSGDFAKVILSAVPQLASKATFADAAAATLSTAEAVSPGIKAYFESAYGETGVGGCGRSAPMKEGVYYNGWLVNPVKLQIFNMLSMPFAVQYALEVPEGVDSLTVSFSAVDPATWSDRTSKITVYMSAGKGVKYAAAGSIADWKAAGKSPLVVGSPQAGAYYILPVGSGFGTIDVYSFDIAASFHGGVVKDGGIDDGGQKDAGKDAGRDGGRDAGRQDASSDDTGHAGDASVPQDAAALDDTGGQPGDGGYSCDPGCVEEQDKSTAPGCSCGVIELN